jgi:hypothetical protein
MSETPTPQNASAPGHALTYARGLLLRDEDIALGKTCACRTCLRTFLSFEDAEATRCPGVVA